MVSCAPGTTADTPILSSPKPVEGFLFFKGLAPLFFSKGWLDPALSFPCNCHHFWTLGCEKCQLSQGSRGSGSPSS